jgi:hypothetical protein
VGLALALGLAACTPGGDDAPATAVRTPEPTASSTPASPSARSTPEPTPTATVLALSSEGVGALAWDTPDALAPIQAELGEPDALESFPVGCGLEDVVTARWGALTVAFESGRLFSWMVNGTQGALPTAVTLPGDLPMGAPLSAVQALDGAQPVHFLENYASYEVQVVGGSGESVFAWFDTDDPTSPVYLEFGRYVLGCG